MAELSRRQQEVLELIAIGYENPHIARRLGISLGSVGTHVKAMLRKLDALNRAHAVAQGYETGILPRIEEKPCVRSATAIRSSSVTYPATRTATSWCAPPAVTTRH